MKYPKQSSKERERELKHSPIFQLSEEELVWIDTKSTRNTRYNQSSICRYNITIHDCVV